MIEPILSMANQILSEIGHALSTTELIVQLEKQFHDQVKQLDVLLSLDQRFGRDAQGKWELRTDHSLLRDTDAIVQQALDLHVKAMKLLNDERQQIEQKRASTYAELEQIDRQLSGLGYSVSQIGHIEISRADQKYTLEFHLKNMSSAIRSLALKLHNQLLEIPAVEVTYNKFHIAYSAGGRFVMIIPSRSRLTILIRTTPDFHDTQQWTRDATGRRLGFERDFSLSPNADLDYAWQLIKQSYQKFQKGGG